MQILTINNRNFQKPSRNPSNRTKVKILKKQMFWIAHQKYLVPRMLRHRGNVRTSKFWRKSKEKKRNFLPVEGKHSAVATLLNNNFRRFYYCGIVFGICLKCSLNKL
jgi:hypothetical protein